ncbi:MAG: thiopurine S-methyltransferase [Sulfurovum sp.]|nr:thiopurine S-methyltransferase [Sulfurovum sp.]
MTENNLWLSRWQNKEIGFHQESVNTFMSEYFHKLNLAKDSHVLVPLCGKSIDISWLLSQGYKVTGIELSEQAIIELFTELNISPSISTVGELTLYSSPSLRVFVGDIFAVDASMVGKIDAIYDRAALVALTQELRIAYATQLRRISQTAPQLLLCFEYQQSLMNRSPYSVNKAEVIQHYKTHYKLECLLQQEIIGGFKGKIPAQDVVWLLTPL